MTDSGNDSTIVPVIAGLVAGILLIATFAFIFRPTYAKTDDELIAETHKLAEVEHFLAKYPDAAVTIDRAVNAKWVMVSYIVQGQLCEPTGFLDDCVKTLRLSIEYGSMSDTHSILVCSGLITGSNSGDITESIDADDCFKPVEQYSSTGSERVLIG